MKKYKDNHEYLGDTELDNNMYAVTFGKYSVCNDEKGVQYGCNESRIENLINCIQKNYKLDKLDQIVKSEQRRQQVIFKPLTIYDSFKWHITHFDTEDGY